MKTIVFAYNNIGCSGIRALLRCGYDIIAVFTHRDDPGENQWFDSVAEICVEFGIRAYAPDDVNSPQWIAMIRELRPDIIFSFYYRKILCSDILEIPEKGCINLHGALLPKYRGCAPINWCVIHGETESGVTLHYMVQKPDAGDIIAQKRFTITDNDTAKDVSFKALAAAEALLAEQLPLIRNEKNGRIPQNESEATYFGRRHPQDGLISWSTDAQSVRNFINALTRPYPGAFTYLKGKKIFIWSAITVSGHPDAKPGEILSVNPLTVACGQGALVIEIAQDEDGICESGSNLATDIGLCLGDCFDSLITDVSRKKIFITGICGFIGRHIAAQLLSLEQYEVYGIDLECWPKTEDIDTTRLHFVQGDIGENMELVEYYIRNCDIVLALSAIASPAEYIRNTIRVFNVDFEQNIAIIKLCAKYRKRLIFPSTSEVYGISRDEIYNEETTVLSQGPVQSKRWIYSCIKQLLDRVILAYGENGLQYTIFRPFNWIGPGLDSLEKAKTDHCRAITRMIRFLVDGQPIMLINGGQQRRCFTYIDDGIDCLMRIIENRDGLCDGRVINIGNPDNDYSIKELAEMVTESYQNNEKSRYFPAPCGMTVQSGESYYGKGYEDCTHRKPDISNAAACCAWRPFTRMDVAVDRTVDFFLKEAMKEQQ